MGSPGRHQRWTQLLDDVEDVLVFVTKDTITLAFLVIGLKVGEFILDLGFTEQHPFVELVRQFTWMPFVIVYFGLILVDLARFLKRKATTEATP